MDGYGELEFDLPSALLEAILQKFGEIVPAALTAQNASGVPEEQGVYALHNVSDGRLLYIGKTDADAGLRRRLTRHSTKLEGRKNISSSDVSFKAVRLYVFAAMDLETALINHFGGTKQVPWNGSGFGSNDPGKERDTTNYKPEHWDYQHPIDMDTPFVEFVPGTYTVAQIMRQLKDGLPFLLRYEKPVPQSPKSIHPDFLDASVNIPEANPKTLDIISACITALPVGWHATALPSHIIVYKDDARNFPSGTLIAQSG